MERIWGIVGFLASTLKIPGREQSTPKGLRGACGWIFLVTMAKVRDPKGPKGSLILKAVPEPTIELGFLSTS